MGSAVNVERRLKIHNRGECPHTSKFMPWKVVYVELFESEELAVRRERQIKKWRGKKKEALIRGDVEELKRLSKRRLL